MLLSRKNLFTWKKVCSRSNIILKLNKTLCRTDAFSGILTNLTKGKLAAIKVKQNLITTLKALDNFSIKDISGPKEKKWTSPWNFANLN